MPALIDAIETWAEHWNDDPKPFVWHQPKPDKIIEKVRRGRTVTHPNQIPRRGHLAAASSLSASYSTC